MPNIILGWALEILQTLTPPVELHLEENPPAIHRRVKVVELVQAELRSVYEAVAFWK